MKGPGVAGFLLCAAVVSCTADRGAGGHDALAAADARADSLLNPLAERYVRLVLAVGQHDEGYVDAYYGPDAWREAAAAEQAPLDTIATRAVRLADELQEVDVSGGSELVRLRHNYLARQLESVAAYVGILRGDRLSFDEESRALYGAEAPTYPESHFQALLDSLGAVLPGRGTPAERYDAWRRDFIIPPERVDTVFRAAIEEARNRTLGRLELPANESFTLELVTDKPWSGYNWYQGDAQSLIQMNVELPIFIDRAIDLAAHEGYPGHHVYNALLEQHLVRGRGWYEFSVYPLYSPQSLIAEGTANYGIDVAFPGDERLEFERDVLFPLAGLDPARAQEYAQVQALAGRLGYAGNEAARAYLNGLISADSAAAWLHSYALMEPARARQRVRFFDAYRSYVINYNYGRDLVADWVQARGGTEDRPDIRWAVFSELLTTPRLPADLQ